MNRDRVRYCLGAWGHYVSQMAFCRQGCRLILLGVFSAGGCSVFRDDIASLGPTLADLPEASLVQESGPVAKASREEIEALYEKALTVSTDVGIQEQVKIRLADIEMARSQDRLVNAPESQGTFSKSISLYDELIASQQSVKGRVDERLLYRASQAYALDARVGESDQKLANLVAQNPDSPFAAEAQFRRAELAFARADYRNAYALYQAAEAYGQQTPFYLNAVYMQGWALFKQDQYLTSLTPFGRVMDLLLPTEQTFSTLKENERNLLADTLKVVAIALSYLHGADSLVAWSAEKPDKQYWHLVYQHLGDFYLEKKRYRDAANSYQAFVEHFPKSPQSPALATKGIDVFLAGGFADEILPAKESYIKRFGGRSDYWRSLSQGERLHSDTLALYLDEVSSFYHSEGLRLKAVTAKKGAEAPGPYFAKAADYYGEWLETFPAQPRESELTFLQAEALLESLQLPSAIRAFERVAYVLKDTSRGATAGYAALLAWDRLIQIASPAELAAHQNARVNSAVTFADHYPTDARALPVLVNAAEQVYRSQDRLKAQHLAQRILAWKPTADRDQQKTAHIIIAHSLFEEPDYLQAESHYRSALTLATADDPIRQTISERIAACMFKQAEANIATGASLEAVNQLLAIGDIAPNSEIAMKGQYDAATHLMGLGKWRDAEKVLLQFKSRYPNSPLQKNLPPKLAKIYQETGDWGKAAEQLALMSGSDADAETRREALYLSAELYQKSGRSQDAITTYTQYLARYPAPFDLAMEARKKLVDLFLEANNGAQADFWLNDMIKADAKAGSARTERSRFLAAEAMVQFANRELRAYESIKLRAPIKDTLKAKRAAMDRTLSAFKHVIDYGVADKTTEANHRIGEVYANLYRDILDSERPKGLDELTLEQYEIMLDEQAAPFKTKAVEMLTVNAERSWQGFYDDWVKASFTALKTLLPARYGKAETRLEVSRGIQ